MAADSFLLKKKQRKKLCLLLSFKKDMGKWTFYDMLNPTR